MEWERDQQLVLVKIDFISFSHLDISYESNEY